MNFIEYTNTWAKNEVLQGRIMIGIGILVIIAFFGIIRSENELLRGAIIPFGILVVALVGYGSYILYSRPAHAAESIAQFEKSKAEAIVLEKEKHINDNKAGKTLMKIYPILAILSLTVLFFGVPGYYKGMVIGFALLFISFYVIDNGFISRSDAFLEYLNSTTF